MECQQRHEERDNLNPDRSEENNDFDLRRGSCVIPLSSIHWANIRPTSTDHDSGAVDTNRLIRARRKDKLASLKLENNELKLKINSVEAKLKAAEKENFELKRYKRISYISTACCLILFIAFAGSAIYNDLNASPDIDFGAPEFPQSSDEKSRPLNISDFRIIPREEWADKELKANISDLEPLPLPVPRGVIALHTSVVDNSCFAYGEDGNIYEGRGTNKGAHTLGTFQPNKDKYPGMSNSNTIGIAMLGKFSDRLPNEKALNAFDMLIRILQTKGILNKCVTLVGKSDVVHREGDSPGAKLVEYWSQNSPYWHQNCKIN